MVMKKICYILASVVLTLVSAGCTCSDEGKAKYIFLFIGDGMSATEVDLTES